MSGTGSADVRRGSRGQAGARAFTLVEILVAGLILALVLVPLIGVLSSGKTDQQTAEGMSEAVALCQDMMEKILSNNLPFQAIDPGGGADYVKGGPGGNVNQAGFLDVSGIRNQSYTKSDLEKILSDGDVSLSDGKYRSKKFKGKPYYVCFFAGKYPDRKAISDPRETGFTKADYDNTLTFAYLEKPDANMGEPYSFDKRAVSATNPFNAMVVLKESAVTVGTGPTIEAMPYSRKSYLVKAGQGLVEPLSNRDQEWFYADPVKNLPSGKENYSLVTGWPDPSSGGNGDPSIKYDINDSGSDQRASWVTHLKEVIRGTKKPTIAYHPKVRGQQRFNSPNGALMKIVLGVKFFPYEHSIHRKNTGDMREFWLASLKANLEE